MFEQFKVYIIVTIAALFTSLLIYTYILSVRLETANIKLAVVDNDSAIQKEKVKEVIKQVEVIKWKTKEKIKIVKELTYDENKTDCDNAIAVMRTTF